MKKIFSMCLVAMMLLCTITVSAQTNKKQVLIQRTFNVKQFNQLQLSGAVKVVYRQGPLKVTAKATQQGLNTLHVKQTKGMLNIYTEGTENRFRSGANVVVYVSAPDLQKLSASGATEFDCEGLSTTNLQLVVSGASSVEIENLKCTELNGTFSGASNAELQGAAGKSELIVSGASDVDAELTGQDLKMTLSGASNGDVNYKGTRASVISSGSSKCDVEVACRNLQLQASGASKIKAEGSAVQISEKTSGASKIFTAKLKR